MVNVFYCQESKRDADTLQKLVSFYREALLQEVVPFWEKTVDETNGGYFTCYSPEGCYDTDKFIWLQARQVWMFSKLCTRKDATAEQIERWTAIARQGADFLRKHADDASGDGYFSTTADGRPLVQPYSIFSDCFMCMAFAQYYSITKEDWAKNDAERKFARIEERKGNPSGKWDKGCGTRRYSSLAVPMIDVNMAIELQAALSLVGDAKADLDERVAKNITKVLSEHPNAENLLRENIAEDPADQDTHEGRSYNPGHSLECCWFLLQACTERGMEAECETIVGLAKSALDKGWDADQGGLYAFMDLEGKPMQQLEFDQKLWWAHLEAILCCLRCFIHTKDNFWWDWFCKMHNYTFEKFWDHKNGGEMWGYLARDGSVSQPIKGGKWKGCFHVPRALWYAEDLLEQIMQEKL